MSKMLAIREELRYAIRSGELVQGEQIRALEEIADEYGAGLSTVKAVLKKLKDSGELYSEGKNLFVGPRPSSEEVASESSSARVSCSGRKCNTSFEIDNWRYARDINRLLRREGWTHSGSKEETLFFCRRCSKN